MAVYDLRFFEERIYNFSSVDYKDLSDDEKFEKLYHYILELEERIEQLEAK